MIIVVQFPIADLRNFIAEETQKLSKPTWPVPEVSHEFVRSYGIAKRRGRGGIRGWVGESRVVAATGAFRFLDQLKFSLKLVGKNINLSSTIFLKSSSRHLYSDGLALAKFETVFVTRSLPMGNLFEVDDLLNSLLDVRVRVPQTDVGTEIVPFGQLPNVLGLSYHLATTSTKAKGYVLHNRWQVVIKKPIIYIELSERENHHIPREARKIIGERFADVYWWMKNYKGTEYLVWSTRYRALPAAPKSTRRQFRISVLRLHAEYQVLQYAIQAILSKRITYTERSPASDFLQTYIKEVTKRIRDNNRLIEKVPKSTGGYLSIWDIRQLVQKCFEIIDPGHADSIFQAVKNLGLRKQIAQKLGDLIIEEVIMGNKIQNAAIIGNVNSMGSIKISQKLYKQWDSEFSEMDFKTLAKELRKLKSAMAMQAATPQHDEEITSVTAAIDSAKKGEGHWIVDQLSKVSTWTLRIAQELGLGVVSNILTSLFFS